MKNYELTYLTSPELSPEELISLSSKISGFITEQEGKIEEISEPIRKKLAYSVKKKREAFLIILNFYLNPEKLKNLEQKIKEENNILRYLINTKKKGIKIPVPKRILKPAAINSSRVESKTREAAKKVELKEIDRKIEEILSE